jgi:deoxyribodipyrimidine photo-lyase
VVAALCIEPTRGAALARLAAVDPDTYARTRNALDGAVTRLSPYLTHGFVNLQEVYSAVHARKPLDACHKLVFEWGWRAYYRHAWAHLGDAIQQSLHQGLLPDSAYQTHMPADVLEAHTGIPVIDLAVRELYDRGYLHNHARMWLASYLVHLRKVHWRTAAQWMLGCLLDGDLASNNLSWQWVAGTGSTKPYLFNAVNVAKYAPSLWHSPGTLLDTSYGALGHMAREPVPFAGVLTPAGADVEPPDLSTSPPGPLWNSWSDLSAQSTEPDNCGVAGRDVWLMHPWSLGADASRAGANVLSIGVGFAQSHRKMPWSAKRWRFVTEGLNARTPHLWWGDAPQFAQALRLARSVHWQAEPHATLALQQLQSLLHAQPRSPVVLSHAEPQLFSQVETYCPSFSQWWKQTRLIV